MINFFKKKKKTTEHTNIELEGMVEWKRTQNTWRKVWCSLFKDREFTFYPDYNKSVKL